jgi:hypothetical protein
MKKIHITRLATIAGVTGALAVASAAMAADPKPAPQKVTVTVINATPEQIARFDRQSRQTDSGMRAYVDANTRQLRAATQAELNASGVRAAPAAKRSTAFAADAANAGPAPESLANGTKILLLDDSHLSYAVATVGKDGKVKQACVDQQPSQEAAIQAASQSGVDSHEK